MHLNGHPADMDALLALAEPRGIAVVEDAAQAHGALYKNRKVGTIGRRRVLLASGRTRS